MAASIDIARRLHIQFNPQTQSKALSVLLIKIALPFAKGPVIYIQDF
jgi:hypothetical protein